MLVFEVTHSIEATIMHTVTAATPQKANEIAGVLFG